MKNTNALSIIYYKNKITNMNQIDVNMKHPLIETSLKIIKIDWNLVN